MYVHFKLFPTFFYKYTSLFINLFHLLISYMYVYLSILVIDMSLFVCSCVHLSSRIYQMMVPHFFLLDSSSVLAVLATILKSAYVYINYVFFIPPFKQDLIYPIPPGGQTPHMCHDNW